MPEFNLRDSMITHLNAQEPWPENVKLFQPYEVEQILLPDNASCLAVQAFLKMCNLPFEVEMRWNAEFMSPSGRVPFIKCGAFVVSELEPIVQFAANKGITLCGRLSAEEKAEMRAYMSLITNVLVNAELYISWVDDDTFNAVTKVRNSSVYPWPLGWLQTRAKRNAVIKRLKALHWHDKTLEQVLADVEQCCNSLSQRLGERDYFFGNSPTPIDALLFGHMRALLSATGPKAALMIKPITSSMLRHLLRMINVTEMKITHQEEYLVAQALQASRHILSPARVPSERSTRLVRTKLYNMRNASATKPFASKNLSVRDGSMSSLFKKFYNQESQQVVSEILDDVLDNVNETVTDLYTELTQISKEFEVITYPVNTDSKLTSDYLDTIDENDVTDASMSMDTPGEEVIQVIDDNVDMDSDGLVIDKHLAKEESFLLASQMTIMVVTDPSDMTKESNVTSSGDRTSKNKPDTSGDSSDTSSTLKIVSSDDLSVESFLRHLRQKTAAHNYIEVADID